MQGRLISAVVAVAIVSGPAWGDGTLSAPRCLRCEYLENPLGIDVPRPRLSWHLTPRHAAERGQRQTAYQVLVASTPEALARDVGDRWDSGRIQSDQSIQVEYAGKALASGEVCYWKVRTCDAAGCPSPWSEAASWSMGLLQPGDWTGCWITGPSTGGQDGLALPLLRKQFRLDKPVRRAMLYVASLGYHRIDVNGRKVGDHEFDPVQSDYSRRVYYVPQDVNRGEPINSSVGQLPAAGHCPAKHGKEGGVLEQHVAAGGVLLAMLPGIVQSIGRSDGVQGYDARLTHEQLRCACKQGIPNRPGIDPTVDQLDHLF